MLALLRYRAKVCACGYHESLTNDPANHFTFEVKTCPVCRGAARFGRMQQAEDERQRKAMGPNVPAIAPSPADGRRTITRLMSPDEVGQLRTPAAPEAAASAPAIRPALRR